MKLRALALAPLFVAALSAACAAPADEPVEADEGEYTSATSRLLEMSFRGELVTSRSANAEQAVRDQMLFTIGQLNGDVGVGRLDKLTLRDVTSAPAADGLQKVTYRATLPVSLSKDKRTGRWYTLHLPRRVDSAGQEAFFRKYERTCTDPWAHDNDAGIYWYYYRPAQPRCELDAADVLDVRASVKVSAENTTDKYPEYDRIWDDGVLDVVAIYGKVEDGATTHADRGIWSHAHFVNTMKRELPNVKTTPEVLPAMPGIETPDVTLESTLPDGRKIRLTSLLVDNVRQGGAAFERRYTELSGNADLIVYNGHAGLGSNVRALARMGQFKRGKYQIIYMNGCDTFAYVDGYLAESRGRLNPDDPTGTKYMEIITNSMPPNWDSLPNNTMVLVRSLAKLDAPEKYQDILGKFDQSGFQAVTGEEDNTFRP